MNTGAERLHSHSGLLTTVAWQLGEQGKLVYALEGGAFVCGAAVQWLRDGLKMIKHAPDIEALALQVKDHGGVEFVPALTGLGAPHWAPDARGTLTGITRGTQRGHIARATLDAIGCLTVPSSNLSAAVGCPNNSTSKRASSKATPLSRVIRLWPS